MKSTKLIVVAAAIGMCLTAGISNAQNWQTTGNAGTDPAVNFIGTSDNKTLKIRTNNAVRVTVTSSGKVGIGNTSPVYKLDVKGSVNTDSLYRIGSNPALVSNASTGNTFAGVTFNTNANQGSYNTYTGVYAGYQSSGSNNAFFGYSAGAFNSTGTDNTLLGQNAGSNNGAGSYNTCVGKASGYFNTASGNTFLGYASGYGNNSGYANTFSGYRTGQLNSNGNVNTYFGGYAGYTNSTGSYNVAVGDSALFSNTTGGNTAMGSKAGFSNTTGNNNSFFGNSSGFHHVTGGFNTFIGREAGLWDSTGTDNTCIGAESGFSINHGISNTFVGSFSGYVASGSNNSLFGKGSGAYLTTGSNNTFIGYASGGSGATTLSNAAAIGANASVTASNSMVLGSGVNVGIGISAPVTKLHIVGGTDVSASGGSYIQTGVSTGTNIGIDDNEIMARNNGATSTLYFNNDGGDVVFNGTNSTGKVMIGTTSPASGYLLSVNGKAICTEMRVELKANWPDYVFNNDYKLMPIKELECVIDADNHLPGLPSAAEIKAQGGIDLGAMQTKMLEKIEELTLYVIQLQKENDSLKNKVEALNK